MSDTTRLDETAAVTAVRNAALDLRGMCSAQGRTEAENVILANIDAVLAEVERLRGENENLYDAIGTALAENAEAKRSCSQAVAERDAALAEVEVLRAELREATKSTLGWRQWVMRGRDAALAENAKLRELLGIDQWSREIEPVNIREIAATEVRKLASQQRDEAVAERDAALAAVTATPENVERLCEVMHDAYERAAVLEGWDTNPESATAWAHVPEANKRTMRVAVAAMLAALGTVAQGVCPHCETSGRCVGSCLDDPREDPNGE